MATTDVAARNVPPVDDLDDSLFDYDVGDVFRDVDTNMDVPAARADEKENGAGLGIDEEIKVTKKRAPVPKLDENRFAPNCNGGPIAQWFTGSCHLLVSQSYGELRKSD